MSRVPNSDEVTASFPNVSEDDIAHSVEIPALYGDVEGAPLSEPPPLVSPQKREDTGFEVHEADMAVAHEHLLKTSCTLYDPATSKFKWRSVVETTQDEIGDYGVGLQLYFEFIQKTGFVLVFIAVLCTPLLVVSYYGDFGGSTAGFFAEMTIGNIGICGLTNEYCADVTMYPDRPLLYGVLSELSASTPAFGGLSTASISVFALFIFWFYYFQLAKLTKRYDDQRITPADYSVEVDHLPHRLRTPEQHGQYELLIKAHFEKIAGQESSVVNVALARDYDGAVRTYLQLDDLDMEIRETREQIKRSRNQKIEVQWKQKLQTLETARAEAENKVERQSLLEEHQRPVVKAFITFADKRYTDRVLNAYTWSRRHFLFRWLQSKPLRFQGYRLHVREACEPDNVYQENLDVSKAESMARRLFTVMASLCVLLVAIVLLTMTQTATRDDTTTTATTAPTTTPGEGSTAAYIGAAIRHNAVTALSIVVVAFLNFVLRLLMFYLADFERAHSLTDKATSEMWKLFFAQFINTAILVLIVNAKFANNSSSSNTTTGKSTWSVAGLGDGLYKDTTKEWFVNIGSGLCLTILIMFLSNVATSYLIELVMQVLRRSWARSKFTQKAMNRQLERGDFFLSMRLAQMTNVIVCVIMYFSGMPVLLWIGALACFGSYWYDKYFLLRCSKIPPNYSNLTVKICLRLMPIAIVANCCFMIWTFGNQMVFPSEFISEAIAEQFASRFNETDMILYISGYPTSVPIDYRTYVESRLFESLRKAAFGGVLVLGVTVIYFLGLLVYFVISKTVWAFIELLMMPCDRRRRRSMLAMERAKITHGIDVHASSKAPTFSDALVEMNKKRVLTSYKIQDNPRFAPAYAAMNKLRVRQSRRYSRMNRASIAAAKGEIVESALDSTSPRVTKDQLMSPVANGISFKHNSSNKEDIGPS